MIYKILSRENFGDTINTVVEYNYDGVIVEVNIAHFMPESEADIILGIENRAVSEKRKLTNTK